MRERGAHPKVSWRSGPRQDRAAHGNGTSAGFSGVMPGFCRCSAGIRHGGTASMPSLVIESLPPDLHRGLKERARRHRRSMTKEAVAILARALAEGARRRRSRRLAKGVSCGRRTFSTAPGGTAARDRRGGQRRRVSPHRRGALGAGEGALAARSRPAAAAPLASRVSERSGDVRAPWRRGCCGCAHAVAVCGRPVRGRHEGDRRGGGARACRAGRRRRVRCCPVCRPGQAASYGLRHGGQAPAGGISRRGADEGAGMRSMRGRSAWPGRCEGRRAVLNGPAPPHGLPRGLIPSPRWRRARCAMRLPAP